MSPKRVVQDNENLNSAFLHQEECRPVSGDKRLLVPMKIIRWPMDVGRIKRSSSFSCCVTGSSQMDSVWTPLNPKSTGLFGATRQVTNIRIDTMCDLLRPCDSMQLNVSESYLYAFSTLQ